MALAILSALAEEQNGLLALLSGAKCTRYASREFWSGTWQGQALVLALSRIGKVAAATTAAALIERFGATRIIFTGVAGGVGDGVFVGDVVVGDSFIQHDLDVSPLFPRYEIPLTGKSALMGDVVLAQALCDASAMAVAGRQTGRGQARVHRGLIASGDRFVNGQTESANIVSALQVAGFLPLAVEMECAAVAQVCADHVVPFAAVRTISDRADDTAHGDFNAFVRDVASAYAQDTVAALLPRLFAAPGST